MTETTDPTNWATSGIELIASFTAETAPAAQIVRAARVAHIPRANLGEPRLTERLKGNLRAGVHEYVVEVLGADGSVRQSIGLEGSARRYFDVCDAHGGLRGGPSAMVPPERDIRSVRIPWSNDASAVSIYRTDVTQKPGSAVEFEITRTKPVLFEDPAGRLSPARLPPGVAPGDVRPIPWAAPWDPTNPPALTALGGRPATDEDGHFVSVESLPDNGPPDKRFDIVITGDGFQERELDRFGALARRLREGFQRMEPFRSLGDRINWHVAYVASADSGVTNCPAPSSRKRTFFGVEGCWGNSEQPAFLGTSELQRAYWVAGRAAPIEQIDLIIVIANAAVYGGHAWPRTKLVIVTANPDQLEELAAHECGHVIGWLAEEYISGIPEDTAYQDPNLAPLFMVGYSVWKHSGVTAGGPGCCGDSVWWKDLADRPGERDAADRSFRFVHLIGEPADPTDQYSPEVKGAQGGEVGAFWGCQNAADGRAQEALLEAASLPKEVENLLSASVAKAESTPPPGGLSRYYWNPQGAFYFRAAARCRMRLLKHDFCRVCQHLIRNRVLEVCGERQIPPLA